MMAKWKSARGDTKMTKMEEPLVDAAGVTAQYWQSEPAIVEFKQFKWGKKS